MITYFYRMDLISLTAISPIDGRYRKQVQHLDEYFSEYGLIKYRVLIEVEYLLFLAQKKVIKLAENTTKELFRIKDEFNLDDAQEIKSIR